MVNTLPQESDKNQEIRDLLPDDCTCYVLVTCRQPSHEGKMEVELNYEGDPLLASYILEGAKMQLDELCENET